ncbi:N-acetylglucosamine kinase [Cohnella sp. REN36]|uniref:N-acetylglucosamine kinase n=1 Tax=Cohnella sp. REN36 TaxID=2887347 RepID=UPI001D15425D|nr:BadF/BadG/BcrA/BcrD ATPase family protein [Cohnella sp. REN36]MCC3377435.1 ATPase [Cohnella sp. REN36]
MNYYLGVDAGGSKTYTLIADERGNVVGKGEGGNGNHQLGYETARRSIAESVEMALDDAGLTPDRITYAYFGLAGADREPDYRILRPMIAELGFPNHDINCDTMIAMRAGTSRPYGVVLICGSGTNSAGRNREGAFYQCGGFTYLFGDFGGGGTIVVEAFRSVIRSWDGRERPTLLTELLLADLGYATVQEMFDDYLDNGKSPPLRHAKLVFEAAVRGDAVAQDILRFQGQELGKSAVAVIRRLGMEAETFDVVLAGSIVTRGKGDFVHAEIRQAVASVAPGASVVKLEVEPVVGALWMAFEADGSPLPPDVYERLRGISDFQSLAVSR